jgi:arsenate reductase
MAPRSDRVLYEYAGCSTCAKAKRWLNEHGVSYEIVPIVERPPTARDLPKLIRASGLPARKWFNTSGQSYRALVQRLGKAKIDALGEDEIVALLAADGKLIKRPVLVTKENVLVGFREEQYADLKA